jgi:hypothetical protein
MGRSIYVSRCGPCSNENPANSNSKVGLESQPPEEQEFPDNGYRSGVRQS